MSWADPYIERLKAGETVKFRPRGRSMEPRIRSGQLVTVEPVKPRPGWSYAAGSLDVRIGDVVLCEVKGKAFLHVVVNERHGEGLEFLIGNMRGFDNGWTPASKVYGKLVRVE